MSNLIAIEPIEVLASNILASNVPLEATYAGAAATAGDTYLVNDKRIALGSETYIEDVSAFPYSIEALTDTTQDGRFVFDDSTDTNQWQHVGPPNRYRAFDIQAGIDQQRIIETKTTNAGSITYQLALSDRVTAAAFLGLSGESITLQATETVQGDLANISTTLGNSYPYQGSLWRYLFGNYVRQDKWVTTDLNIPGGATLDLTIDAGSEQAEASAIVFGASSSLGAIKVDPTREIRSRSSRRFDGLTNTLVRRNPSSRVTFPLVIQNKEADGFWYQIKRLDGVAAVFVPSGSITPELTVYGVISSVRTTAKTESVTYATVEVESL